MQPSSSSDTVPQADLEQTSERYVGQWHRLVTTTNWEKGRIIFEWRTALIEAGAPPSEYSDETWSRRIGNVSPQHVGRLRRVYERFSSIRDEFDGLYWSHFQAALDWNDAEMWLQGAIENGWSVSQMRQMRWEALGGTEPREDDIVEAEFDEDQMPLDAPAAGSRVQEVRDPTAESHGGEATEANSPDAPRADAPDDDFSADSQADQSAPWEEQTSGAAPSAASFEQLDMAAWPDDLAEAFDEMKLAIVRHRMAGWSEISPADVLTALDALRQLVLAPQETD